MKQAKRKFLSLLLVLVMALAMVPSAAAYYPGYPDPYYPNPNSPSNGYGFSLKFSNGGSSAYMNLGVNQSSGVPSFEVMFYNSFAPALSRPISGPFNYSASGNVSVDPNGMVTGLRDGYGTVTISYGGQSLGSVSVAVGTAQGYGPTTPDMPSNGGTPLTNYPVRISVAQNASTVPFSTPGQNSASIYDQIVGAIASYESSYYYPGYYPNYGNGSLRGSYTITVVPVNGSESVATLNGNSGTLSLQSLASLSLTIKQQGTWYASFSVRDANNNQTAVSGSITVEFSNYAGSGLSYTGALGSPVALNVADFTTFWRGIYGSNARLDSVTINTISGLSGVLCYDHSYSESSHKSAAGKTFYTYGNVSYNQSPLSSLTFFPTPSYNNIYPSGTVTITFTATGSDSSYGTSRSTNGTISILYGNNSASAINVAVTNSVGMLKAADFDAVYRQYNNNNYLSPSYSVQFTKLPTMGTLYYNYTGTNYGKGTAITYSNMSTQFSNQSYGPYSLSNVAYVSNNYSGAADSATYAVYNGSTLLFTGTINFIAGANVNANVSYVTSGAPVQFKAKDFFPTTSMQSGEYIVFGNPTYGSLYKNYSTSRATLVSSVDRFSYVTSSLAHTESIESVTYVPQAGYNGKVEIPYYVYTNSASITRRGTVTISVNSIKFSDVSSSAWYGPYVSELVAANVIGGYEDGTFRPNGLVTNGEALKLIMKAVGYSDQNRTSKHWASGFLSTAYYDGIVSSMSMDLDAPITRNAFASMAAKALKLQPVNYGTSPFADSSDGYVRALYNIIVNGERIINGTAQGGSVYFNGNDNIRRSEMSKIICLMYRYKNTNTVNPTYPPVAPNYPNYSNGAQSYILDAAGKVFHTANCPYAPHQLSPVVTYRATLTGAGYTACPFCRP